MGKCFLACVVAVMCACGADDGFPPPIPPVDKVLDTKTCVHTEWVFGGESSPTVFDLSYDENQGRPGIQAEVAVRHPLGRPPFGVRVVVLQDGHMLRTVFSDGWHRAQADIQDNGRRPQVVMFRVFTYGWCDQSGFSAVVDWFGDWGS